MTPTAKEPRLVSSRNPALKLDHAAREVMVARYFGIPAEAIDASAREEG